MNSNDLNFTKIKILLTFVFIIFAVIIYYSLNHFANKNKNEHLNQVTERYERAYNTVYQQYKELSYVLYTGFARLSEAEYNFKRFAKANQDEKKLIQKEIYDATIVRYKEITNKHLRNINFIDNNKHILLKLKNPKHNGKKISKLRRTIHEAFHSKKPIDSYEVGKNGAGFKFVYPVMNQDKNVLGAISITFGAEAITSDIMKQYYVLSNFFVSDKKFNKFNVKRSMFKESHHEGYLFDKLVLKELKKITRMDIKQLKPSKKMTDLIRKKGFHGKPQSLYSNEINMIFTTIPIYNKVSNELEAILTVRSKGNIVNILNNYFTVIYGLVLLILAGVLSFLFQEYTKRLMMRSTIEIQEELLELYQQKEKELKTEKDRFQLAIDGTKDGLWDWDIIEENVYFSPQYKAMLGYDVDEFDHHFDEWHKRVHPDDIDRSMLDIQAHLQGKTKLYESEFRVKHKDGSWVWILARGKALFDEQNNPVRMIGFHTNLTKRKELERKMLNSEKMSSLGEMIGNIAHQWRQPLSVISTTSSGMSLQKEIGTLSDENFLKHCKTITEQTEALSQTIEDFRDYIKGEMELEPFSLTKVIDKVINIEKSILLGNGIDVVFDLDDNLKLESYPNAIVQSMINIINNAKDALEDVEGNRYIFISTVDDNNNIKICIKDNAGGIPEDIVHNIYEAYFTTKHKFQGTGLGLHMTYNLITNQLNGVIENSNAEYVFNGMKYKGAEFIITLPKIIKEKKEI